MPITLLDKRPRGALPVHLVGRGALAAADLPPAAKAWARAHGFDGEAGKVIVYPDGKGGPAGAPLPSG